MTFENDTMLEMMNGIWTSMLGVEVRADENGKTPQSPGRTLTSCVQITGDFEGAVTLDCTEKLARAITGLMFEVDPDGAEPEEIQDAMGEMANMVGGSVKTMIGGDCKLSLPSVTGGGDYKIAIPGSTLKAERRFQSQGEPLVLRILERTRELNRAGAPEDFRTHFTQEGAQRK